MIPREIVAVTFDVTGTLIHSPMLGEIYAEVLGRHGSPVDAAAAERVVHETWQEYSSSLRLGENRFASHPDGARGWWYRFLDRVCAHLELPPPSPFAKSELYQRFARPDAWRVFPEVPEVLARLRARRLRLGVISNWDERLPGVLEGLGLGRFFQSVVFSAAAGAEKPYPSIFRQALEQLGAPAERALHVGDGRGDDVEGAWGVGMKALLLNRGEGAGDLKDLRELCRVEKSAGAQGAAPGGSR